MKKKFLTIVGVAAFAVAVVFNINAGVNRHARMDVTLTDVETLAGCEVSSNKELNKGTCKKNYGSYGDSCVVSDGESPNCSSS